MGLAGIPGFESTRLEIPRENLQIVALAVVVQRERDKERERGEPGICRNPGIRVNAIGDPQRESTNRYACSSGTGRLSE